LEENSAICPDCGEKVPLKGKIMVGQLVICPKCEAELEVVETIPLELDFVYEDQEDEDEDEDDFEVLPSPARN